jgi:hypothetical protein
MADNFDTEQVSTPGHIFASHDEAGVQHPFAKLVFGPKGAPKVVEDLNGSRVPVQPAKAAAGTVTGVAQNIASVSLLAANANRKGGRLVNASTAILYVRFEAAAASIASAGYSSVLNPNQEMPIPDCYTGEIRGIWDAAGGGYANITELA